MKSNSKPSALVLIQFRISNSKEACQAGSRRSGASSRTLLAVYAITLHAMIWRFGELGYSYRHVFERSELTSSSTITDEEPGLHPFPPKFKRSFVTFDSQGPCR